MSAMATSNFNGRAVAPLILCATRSTAGLIESIVEISLRNADAYALDGLAFDHAFQEFLTNRRQHGVGENRIDHPSAALSFGAAAHYELHYIFIVVERNLV